MANQIKVFAYFKSAQSIDVILARISKDIMKKSHEEAIPTVSCPYCRSNQIFGGEDSWELTSNLEVLILRAPNDSCFSLFGGAGSYRGWSLWSEPSHLTPIANEEV